MKAMHARDIPFDEECRERSDAYREERGEPCSLADLEAVRRRWADSLDRRVHDQKGGAAMKLYDDDDDDTEHPCRAQGKFGGWIDESDGMKRCRTCGEIITERRTLDAIDWLRKDVWQDIFRPRPLS